MERLLSLDISSRSTGWAFFDNGKLLDYGLIEISSKLGWGARLVVFGNEVKRLLFEKQPTSVVIEDIYRGPSLSVFKLLSFFHGVAYQHSTEYLNKEPTPLGVLKARAAIGGKAGVKCTQKEQAFFIINNTLKLKLDFAKDNDIADACALAYGHMYLEGIKPHIAPRFNKKQYEAIPTSKKKGKRNGSIQSTRVKKKRKQSRSKKSVSKTGTKVSPG